MNSTYNDHQHKQTRAKAELAGVGKELKQLRIQLASLEDQRAKLLAELRFENDDRTAPPPLAKPLT